MPDVAIRVIRLGTDRLPDEGIRFGTVRRPPRGVLKADYGSRNFYDVWMPTLAPSASLVKQALGATSQSDWERFVKKYRSEMSASEAKVLLEALAALSHQTNFSIGCYCADESRCHRSVLRELLRERGAAIRELDVPSWQWLSR